MAITYPTSPDNFNVPTEPEGTPLSEAGTSLRNHTSLHDDTNQAIIKLEQIAAQITHDHSGSVLDTTKGVQLAQANTHLNPDTDASVFALHHTLGTGATQAAAGNHTHVITFPSVTFPYMPYIICTSTTRPNDPKVGTMIWETDTNAVRAWASFPNNVQLGGGADYTDAFTRDSTVASFDATGGTSAAANTITWTHNLGSNASAVLVAVANFAGSAPNHNGWTNTVTCDGVAMTELGSSDCAALDTGGVLKLYGLLNPATTGVRTISVTMSHGGVVPYLVGQSFSYSHVGAFGTLVQDINALGVHPSIEVPSTSGNRVFGAFMGSRGALSEPSGTQRGYSYTSGAGHNSLLVQDRPGSDADNSSQVQLGCDTAALDTCVLALNLIAAASGIGDHYHVTYVTGNSPSDGAMATPTFGSASWVMGNNNTCRCIAQNIDSAGTTTDDQTVIFTTTSAIDYQLFHDSPTNDVYLRMSADRQTYVRLELTAAHATFYSTTSGPGGEQVLGSVSAGTQSTTAIEWEVKASERTFTLYRGGVQILVFTDSNNVTQKGEGYRTWGIGMTATEGRRYQLVPANLASVHVQDAPRYSTTPIWQLLNVGAVPYVRAETHVSQEIAVGRPITAFWDMIWEDIFAFFGHGSIGTLTPVPQSTDIVITESGHYDCHASIHWDPGYPKLDHGMVGFTVNGIDIGRKNWEFIRGNAYSPGFAQTNEIYMSWHFAAGDVLRVVAQHNAPTPARLFFDTSNLGKQVCSIDIAFTGP